MSLFPHDVRRPDGRLASGLGFGSWPEKDGIRVLIVTVEPRDGIDARAPETQIKDFEPTFFRSFVMKVGESRPIEEMKAWGFEPWTLRIYAAGEFNPGK